MDRQSRGECCRPRRRQRTVTRVAREIAPHRRWDQNRFANPACAPGPQFTCGPQLLVGAAKIPLVNAAVNQDFGNNAELAENGTAESAAQDLRRA